jgi:hypothetical protein
MEGRNILHSELANNDHLENSVYVSISGTLYNMNANGNKDVLNYEEYNED